MAFKFGVFQLKTHFLCKVPRGHINSLTALQPRAGHPLEAHSCQRTSIHLVCVQLTCSRQSLFSHSKYTAVI